MANDPAVGDRVKFKVGLGESWGTVVEYLEDDKVLIDTDKGKQVSRYLHSIVEVDLHSIVKVKRAAPKKGGGRKKKMDAEE